jgi:peptidyl-tRNA hydrolase, PTH1 family
MLVIVGLGNWGEALQDTRHNIGFMVLDRLLPQISPGKNWRKNSRTGCLEVRGEKFLLAKPQALMNLSGPKVKRLVDFYRIDSQDLLLIHDDLDLNIGEIKVSKEQGPAGHHGVESVIEALGASDFWRVRIGIGRPEESRDSGQVANFVLSRFSEKEEKFLERVVEEIVGLLSLAIKKGVEEVRGKRLVIGRQV